jgi:autotransporter adhesin
VVLTNVANGTSQYDAVNFGQLSALQDQVTDLNGQVSNLRHCQKITFTTLNGACAVVF